MTSALNVMQQAYMVGRTADFPLGAVDMQDVRCFLLETSSERVVQAISKVFASYPLLQFCIAGDNQSFANNKYQSIESNLLCATSQVTVGEIEDLAQQRIENFISKPFDVHDALWRIALDELTFVETGNQKSLVTFSFNGLLLDGFAISRIIAEVLKCAMTGEFRPSLAIINTFQNQSLSITDETNWPLYFRGVESVIQLPWSSNLETIMWTQRKRVSLRIEKNLFEAVHKCVMPYGVFSNSAYLFAVLKALSNLNGRETPFVISIPTSKNSANKELGNHSAFLPVVYHVKNSSLLEELRTLQDNILGMLASAADGMNAIQYLSKQLKTILPLPVAFTNGLLWDIHESIAGVVYLGGTTETPQLALDIRLSHLNHKTILLELDYAVASLSEEIVQSIAKQIVINLKWLANKDNLTELPMVPVQADVIKKGETSISYAQAIFENIYTDAMMTKPALASQERMITYSDLGKYVAQASNILGQYNIDKGDVVAIALPKCFEYVYYALASLFAGVVWFPLDNAAPIERIVYQLRNAKARGVICDIAQIDAETIKNKLDITIIDSSSIQLCADVVQPRLNLLPEKSPSCYLYTSGTTGLPKCVALNNTAINNTIKQTIQEWHLNSEDKIFSATPFYHDMSLFDILATFTVGATLIVPEKENSKDPFLWSSLLQKYEVTIWVSVPAIVDMLLMAADFKSLQSLRLLAQGGDYIREKTLRMLRSYNLSLTLYSLGGPTETTIWSIWHKIDIDKDIVRYGSIPYGVALSGNNYYILDEQNGECDVGELGRIAMSGINLSNGYIVDGELRCEDYKDIELRGKYQKVYVASDMGKLSPAGLIIFEGREEGYFKIKGVRVSAKEIENAVLMLDFIEQCVAVELQDDDLSYAELGVAYTLIDEEFIHIGPDDLINALNTYLPESHIPTRWLRVNSMPLTANSKIDRQHIRKLMKASDYSSQETDDVELNLQQIGEANPGISLDKAFYEKFLSEMQGSTVTNVANDNEDKHILGIATEHEQRAWFLHERDPLSLMASINVSFHLVGNLNLIRFISSINALYDGLSSFNLAFFVDEDGVLRREHRVYKQDEVIFLLKANTLEEAKTLLWQQFIKPIDLAHTPIVRFYLVMLGDSNGCVFGIHSHHILMDNSAWPVVLETLSKTYNEVGQPMKVRYPAAKPIFSKRLYEAQAEKEAYWKKRFSTPLSGFYLPDVLGVKTAKVEAFKKSHVMYSELDVFRYIQTVKLEELRPEYGDLTLAQLIFEFGLFLLKKVGDNYIDIVTPITDTQMEYQLDNLQSSGNLLPIRVSGKSDGIFSSHWEDIQTQIQKGMINELPYEEIINVTNSNRDTLPTVLVTAFDLPEKYINLSDIQAYYLDIPPLKSPYVFMLAYCFDKKSRMIRFELTANEGINHFVAGSLLEEFVQLLSVKPNEIRNLQEISKGQIVTIDGKDSILKLVMQVYSEVLPRKWQIHDNFFNVGGHSLVATLAVGKFKNQYGLKVEMNDIFAYQTPYELSTHLSSKNQGYIFETEKKSVQAVDITEIDLSDVKTGVNYPVSLLQESYLWEADLGQDTKFNIPFVFKINMDIESDILRQIFIDIIMRHTALRSLIVVGKEDNSLYQRILSAEELEEQYWFSSSFCNDEEEAKTKAVLAGGFSFNLISNIPLRVTHLRLKECNYLSVLFYHSAFDEWSAKIFIDEFISFLVDRFNGNSKKIMEQKNKNLQYVHFALEEFNNRENILTKGLSFWKKRLGILTEEKGLVICLDEKKSAVDLKDTSEKYTSICFAFNNKEKRVLNNLAVETKTSLFQVVYALVALSLYKLGAGEKIVVGTSMACREDYKYHQTIGFFTNVVLQKVNIRLEETFSELLNRLQSDILEIGEFNKIPFPYVVEKLAEKTAHNICEYYIQMHPTNPLNIRKKIGNKLLNIELLEQVVQPSKFGLHFEIFDEPLNDEKALVFLIHFNNTKYSEASLAPLVSVLKGLVSNIVSIQPTSKIESVINSIDWSSNDI